VVTEERQRQRPVVPHPYGGKTAAYLDESGLAVERLASFGDLVQAQTDRVRAFERPVRVVGEKELNGNEAGGGLRGQSKGGGQRQRTRQERTRGERRHHGTPVASEAAPPPGEVALPIGPGAPMRTRARYCEEEAVPEPPVTRTVGATACST